MHTLYPQQNVGPSGPPPSYNQAVDISGTGQSPVQRSTVPAGAPHQYPFASTRINQTYPSPLYDYAGPSVSTTSGTAGGSSALPRNVEDTSADKDFLDGALEFTHHLPPPSSAQTRLSHPVAVPQVAARLGMPFARAYSPVLQDRGIPIEEFIEFIDNLNVVSTASPPLQVLDLAGGVVGMVPHHIPMMVGNALSLTAKLGTGAVSKGRSAMFLEKANTAVFAPRGLKVELATSKALKARLGLDPDAEMVSALEDSEGLDVQQRRLRALEGHISPLTFDVPPPNKQTNNLERMSAWQVQRQLQTSEKKALKDREKALDRSGSYDDRPKAPKGSEKEMAKIERERGKIEGKFERKSGKGDRHAEKASRKRETEVQKLDREVEKTYKDFEKGNKKNKKGSAKEDKEVDQANKVLWILIEDS